MTDIYSKNNFADIIKIFKNRNHKSKLSFEIKIVCNNISLCQNIDFIYIIFLK